MIKVDYIFMDNQGNIVLEGEGNKFPIIFEPWYLKGRKFAKEVSSAFIENPVEVVYQGYVVDGPLEFADARWYVADPKHIWKVTVSYYRESNIWNRTGVDEIRFNVDSNGMFLFDETVPVKDMRGFDIDALIHKAIDKSLTGKKRRGYLKAR